MSDRLESFLTKTRDAQTTLIVGKHFTDLETLTRHYLPKPALDFISARLAELLKRRPIVIDDGQANEAGQKDIAGSA
jgi:hypothetical protein